MRDSDSDLEATLDRVIGQLSKPGAPREARALLVDARRLVTLVRNWKTIAPTDAARAEMLQRIDSLLEVANAVAPPEPVRRAPEERPRRGSPAPVAPVKAPPDRGSSPADRGSSPAARRAQPPERSPFADPDQKAPDIDEGFRTTTSGDPFPRWHAPRDLEAPPSLTLDLPPAVPAKTVPPGTDEPTLAAPLAVHAQASRERAAAKERADEDAAQPRRDPMRPRTLPDLDISGVAELMDEPPAFSMEATFDARRPAARPPRDAGGRGLASSTPPQGRRVAGEDRPSRFSQLIDDPETNDGVPFPATGEEPGRPTPRPTRGSSPPPAARDKVQIAVRPLPAPEVLDKRLVLLNDPYSKRAEAYRTLRRKLSGPGAPRTIAVTSAQPGEGKSTCAVNLALAFRETSNEKVLLVEANLRAPALAKLFGFEPPVCFAKQMAKHRETNRAAWTVAELFEPLHILAVDPASKTSPLLDAVAFANALEQLVLAGYDHIIVDTPPALGGSDVNLVADSVDGVVVVAWIKKSRKSQVKQAIDQLKPATILGVVTLEG